MQLEHLATKATERIPRLVVEQRGDIEVHRPSHRSLDTVFALKLIQLVGNLKAGESLVREGCYFEWDMVKRLVYETLEDIDFLARGDATDDWTTVHERYLASFFAEDFGEDGSVIRESVRPVQRREITEYLQEEAGYPAGGDAGDVARDIGRIHSASVHGRLTGIMRGFFEAPQERFWIGGRRHKYSVALERLALGLAASDIADEVAHSICARWWGEVYRRETAALAGRLRTALGARYGFGA